MSHASMLEVNVNSVTAEYNFYAFCLYIFLCEILQTKQSTHWNFMKIYFLLTLRRLLTQKIIHKIWFLSAIRHS